MSEYSGITRSNYIKFDNLAKVEALCRLVPMTVLDDGSGMHAIQSTNESGFATALLDDITEEQYNDIVSLGFQEALDGAELDISEDMVLGVLHGCLAEGQTMIVKHVCQDGGRYLYADAFVLPAGKPYLEINLDKAILKAMKEENLYNGYIDLSNL